LKKDSRWLFLVEWYLEIKLLFNKKNNSIKKRGN
jgi:hypothetical protein